jgi:hypothetical protein
MRVNNRRAERGFSLAELTTALAVFVIVMTAALLVYDRSNRIFSQNAQSADMQQTTRVAYEKVLQDVRLAGFDYKRAGVPTSAYPTWTASTDYSVGQMVLASPNNGYIYRVSVAGTSGSTPPTSWTTSYGSPVTDNTVTWVNAGRLAAAFDQPDEQVEYAWSSAITVRGNYNYDAPNDAKHYDHGRETQLESSQFPIVTTGNDEIVTYALVSNKPGAANGDTITFFADVNNGGTPSRTAYPGGNAERQIDITGVDLSNANPPYTLYRFTLAEDGSVVRTPLADNIRSMTFSYWEDQKATIPLKDLQAVPVAINPPNVGGSGQYDPSNAASDSSGTRLVRRKIRAVTVDLVGMNPVPDANFNDGDTVAPNYRKMALSTTIVPRNLGIRTLPQSAVQIPPPPTSVNVCVGYCGLAVVSWTPGNPSTLSSTGSTGDETFSIVWDTSDTGNFTNWLPAGQLTTYAADLTQKDLTQNYYFKVAATNNVGTSFSSMIGPVSLKNATKPSTTGLTATGAVVAGVPKITLGWSAPTTNASGAPSCTSGASPAYALLPAEQQGFKVYRNTTGNTPTESELISNIGGSAQTTDGNGHWSLIDTAIEICQPYNYFVKVCEWCQSGSQNVSGNASDGFSDLATYSTSASASRPSVPTGVAANGSCDFSTNACTNKIISWNKVTSDIATPSNTIQVDRYAIFRKQVKGSPTGTVVTADQQVASLTGYMNIANPTWTDTAALLDHDPSDYEPYYYVYYVIAKTNCGDSDPSATAYLPTTCPTGVTVTATAPLSGSGAAGSPWEGPTAINLNAPSGASITAAFYSLDGGALVPMSSPWRYTYSDNYNGAQHTLIFIVKTSATTCYQRLATVYYEESTLGCHITTGLSNVVSTYSLPSGYMNNNYDNGFAIKIQNIIPTSSIQILSVTATVTVPAKNIAGGGSGGTFGTLTPVMWPSQTPYSSTSPAATNNPSPCPSAANPATNGATGASNSAVTCNFTFTPPTADNTVPASSSRTFDFMFTHKGQTGAGAPSAANFTSIAVRYKQNTCLACSSDTFTCTIVP